MGLSLIKVYTSDVQSFFQLGLSCGSSLRLQDLPIITNYKQNNSTFIGEACGRPIYRPCPKTIVPSGRLIKWATPCISQITTRLADRWVGQHMFCNIDFGQGLYNAGPTSARAV